MNPLGWVFMGPTKETHSVEANVDQLLVGDSLFDRLEAMWALEFDGPKPLARPVSIEDKEAISLPKANCLLTGGHIELPLPWQKGSPCVPNNKPVALRRLYTLRRRLWKNQELNEQYTDVMTGYIAEGHAEWVRNPDLARLGEVWYLPHHSVVNPMKPEKLRIVFDCASKYQNTSINSQLLPGPDLTNNLCGVLTRLRNSRTL